MGLLFSRIWKKLFGANNEFKILILGLANVGKTTILYQLHLGKVISTQPTIGSNVEEVSNKNVKFQVWDLGGQETIRSCWSSYFQGTNAIIFVVDSTDKKNEVLSKTELFNLISHEELKNVVFLIMANKQDLEEAMNEKEISEKLNLTDIKNHDWHIQACSAKNGTGLTESLDWLSERLLEKTRKKK